ncbi:hypothetical protein [Okeania sp. SIO2B3]|uniref:hypothetical protein n=1 Tax=Okeania sp. SIO2B3 TaxID=2607784 RepID=UPI0013C08849|nr:hypothetical protein [Okeania sp. SIO2B3]NET44951.1 hypothetical protein [Okeania sp. SIO2B3]
MKIYLETSSVENLPFSQFESEAKMAKIRALLEKKIRLVRPISYREKFHND